MNHPALVAGCFLYVNTHMKDKTACFRWQLEFDLLVPVAESVVPLRLALGLAINRRDESAFSLEHAENNLQSYDQFAARLWLAPLD